MKHILMRKLTLMEANEKSSSMICMRKDARLIGKHPFGKVSKNEINISWNEILFNNLPKKKNRTHSFNANKNKNNFLCEV